MRTKFLMGAFVMASLCGTAFAEGDVAMGKAKYDEACEECHYDDDFSGESAADIAGWIQEIVDGEVDHKGDIAGLTAEEIASLAAFFASK